ncbi:hypothetical protein L1889_14565 [Paenalcaligenes niemegkensis]|uniref:hypothetical protein n=1 Tax=Paenalcaligenes niemegkensis TaxID=2895469 RepID=UPI001EE8B266|nr:hypothetical protein [Paenalcaligenes niemegkensis]MCQ9617745.1 hypothetical protein [Paenalcaligenes niemegkensis]
MNELINRYRSQPIGEQVAPYLAQRKAIRHTTPVFNFPRFGLSTRNTKNQYAPSSTCEA